MKIILPAIAGIGFSKALNHAIILNIFNPQKAQNSYVPKIAD
jgi:hypothetical protein